MIIKDLSGDVAGNVTRQICQFCRKSSNFKYAKKNPSLAKDTSSYIICISDIILDIFYCCIINKIIKIIVKIKFGLNRMICFRKDLIQYHLYK